jgi:non-heme chloroperoxidase
MMNLTADIRFGSIAARTGVRLHYAEVGSPGGEPVLFLHGYTDSWYSFSPVLSLLPLAVHAFALDQRGHGDSERPQRGYTMADFAADAVAFLDALGVRRATVVGHSMGSFVAQRVAIDHPDRVERLVLIGSYTTAVNEGVLGLTEQIHALADPVPAEFVREFQLSTAYRALPESFLDRVVSESGKLPARVCHDVLAGIMAAGSRDDLHKVRAPTLILWGNRDAIFGREEQERLRDGIPAATLRIYPDTGHALHWEQPERFVQDFLEFLTSAQ